jgi:hypothetical protein
MSTSGIQTAREARRVRPAPAPPSNELAQPRSLPQLPARKGREHEVQRLIRDLAALAASQGRTA